MNDLPSPKNPEADPSEDPSTKDSQNSVESEEIEVVETPVEVEESEAPEAISESVSEISEEDRKHLKRKKILAGIGGVYLFFFLLIFVWATFLGPKTLTFFNVLPITQAGFQSFLYLLFQVLWGSLTLAAAGLALYFLFKSIREPKAHLEEKKHLSKKALLWGLGFLGMGFLWIFALLFLDPRLLIENRYSSYILTDPEDTIGLTAPVEVTFDATQIPYDKEEYRVLSYSWNFGDGETGNGMVISHMYEEKGDGDGQYTVVLTVTFMDLETGEQFKQEFETEVVIVNEKVAAIFTATPDSGNPPLTVEFDASASLDPDGEIVKYEWDFDGDGKYDDDEGAEVSYTFTKEGEFEVGLRVTDNNGEYDTETMTIEVGTVGGLQAIITAPLPSGEDYVVGKAYTFSGQLSQIKEGEIDAYTWDFGDGSDPVETRNASHVFEEPGEYTISLTVESDSGGEDTETLEITVLAEGSPPDAVISTNQEESNNLISGSAPFTVKFDGEDSTDPEDDIIDYDWDFDSNGIVDSRGPEATYTYDEEGIYEVTLTVTDAAGHQETDTLGVEVGAAGVFADISANVTSGEAPLTVTFDASGSSYKNGEIVSYEWDFGDGGEYTGQAEVSYKYKNVGTYTAKVTVIAEDGEKATASIQIVVRPVSLNACFTANPSSGSAPLFVSVNPSCSTGTIDSYIWDFGNGEKSFDRTDTVTYDVPGLYTITLEISTEDGIVDIITQDIQVR